MKKNLTVLFLFVVQLAVGQDPYYHVIDKAKGLPSNSVYDIYQDKTGFMWFATDDGLCRYDGAKFTTYYSETQTSRAGSKIEEDKFDRVWYSNFDGYLYYVEKGQLQQLNQEKPIGFYSYAIMDDFLLVLKKGAVCKYDLKTLKLVGEIEITDNRIISSAKMNNGFYLLADKLYIINADGTIHKLSLPNDFYPSLKQAIMTKATPQGLLFVSKITNDYFLYNKGVFYKKNKINYPGYVHNLTFIDRSIWLFSPKGAYELPIDKEQGRNYFKQFNISCAYKDNRNNYWFSTLNKGLILVPNFDNSLIEMSSRPIRLGVHKKRLIVSTEDEALFDIDVKNNRKHLIFKGNSNHSISQLFVDTAYGNIMFSSNTFNIFSPNSRKLINSHVAVKQVEKIDHKYYSFAASGFMGLFIVGQSQQKSEWDSVYNSRKDIGPNFNEIGLLDNVNGKSTAYNATNSTIYYATNVGLLFVNKTRNGELKFSGETLFIKNLVAFGEKVYALSTNGKLYEIDKDNQLTISALAKEYPITGAYRISRSNSFMFIYATSGLYCYDVSKKNIRQLPNSYQDFEVTDIVDYGDRLIMATSKGVLIEPNKIKEQTIDPVLVIGGLSVNNKKVENGQLLNFSYNENNVSIGYSLLAYTIREKAPIYYKLNNDKWQQLDEQSGNLKLSSLSPGKYEILFKVGDRKKYTRVSFAINKPFWFSFWFLSLLFILILSIVYLLYRYKIEQNNKRNQHKLDRVSLENSLNQSKLKAIKSQMNPHFFYNALNTIQSYILSNEKKQAVSYLSKFANLTRTILEMSEREEVALAEEIKTIGFYLDIEKARFDGDFDYTITEVGIDKGEDLRMPSMLLQPYLENAIKHGLLHKEGDKKLQVIFKKEKGKLTVTIDDNGIGRKKSMALNEIKQLKHKSFATAAMQSRIDLLNKNKQHKISVSYIDKIGINQQGTGTVVIIELPLT